jgi:parallel beta-helix repeat protein
VYNLSSEIMVDSQDQGSATARVAFRGSPNGAGTVLDRGGSGSVFSLSNIESVEIAGFRIRNAYAGVALNYGISGSVIRGNQITGCVYGIYLSAVGVRTAAIENNVLAGNGTGVILYSGEDTRLANNTFVKNTGAGLRLSSGVSGTVLRNNIFWQDGAGHCIYDGGTDTVTAASSDYNLFYATGGASVGYFQIATATLAVWRATTGLDRSSLSGDPLFANAAQDDYRLQANSPAVDAGTNVGAPVTDQRGAPRILDGNNDGTATADIGAVEYFDPAFLLVSSFLDTVDAHPGDGIVADARGNATLRAAIMEANARAGDDTIILPAGTYTLSLAGAGEDGAATGDLDVTKDQTNASQTLTIVRAGAASTIIDGADLDRLFHVLPGATLNLSGVTVRNGQVAAGHGGGILNEGTLILADSVVTGNQTTDGSGGGIFSSGTLAVTGTTVSSNTASGYGGGISGGGTSTISDATISSNSASAGGGVYADYGSTATLIGTSVTQNSSGRGGGICLARSVNLTLAESTVAANASSARGGGIATGGSSLHIVRSTISGNTASTNGGGIENEGGTVEVTGSTISGNQATNAGGGIENFSNGTLKLTNATVSNNTATVGGGIDNASGAAALKNTIIAGNTAGGGDPDASGALSSLGHNLIGNVGAASGFTHGVLGDVVGTSGTPVDPKLGPLQNNGGPTQTHSPLAGSPAIDAGDDSGAPVTDQRGAPRKLDGDADGTAHADIGAVEYLDPSWFFVDSFEDTVDANPGDGVVADAAGRRTLRAAVMEANAKAGADTIVLRSGTYGLSLVGAGEYDARTGDINVCGDLTILGADAGSTIIDANRIDRVFYIHPMSTVSTVAIAGVTIRNGAADEGGGIANGGTLTLTNVALLDNSAVGNGGGILNRHALTLVDSTVSHNTADGGGAILAGDWYISAVTTIIRSVISGNSAVVGGGIWSGFTGVLTVVDSTIADNTAPRSSGGGLFNRGEATIRRSTIAGNVGYDGGGVCNEGSLTVEDSTIADNSVSSIGAGLYNANTLTVRNSTLSGNTAAQGGAIFSGRGNYDDPALVVVHSTLSSNSAQDGGGIYFERGMARLQSTLVAGNSGTSANPDLRGTFTSDGHNLIGNVGTATGFVNGQNGDIVGGGGNPVVDPLLGPLQDNGGPTRTYQPLAGSPVIDAGDNAGAAVTDQRGAPRILDGNNDGTAAADIGAVEYFDPAWFFVDSLDDTVDANPGDGIVADANGHHTLRAAIMEANAHAAADTIVLSGGRYDLSRAGAGEDAAATGDLDVAGDLTIIGAGSGTTIIDANHIDRVLDVLAGSSLDIEDVTVAGGSTSGDGGGIHSHGTSLRVTRGTVTHNSGDRGGGIYDYNGAVTVTQSTISENTASQGAGLYQYVDGTLDVLDSTISDNQSLASDGGGHSGRQRHCGDGRSQHRVGQFRG